MSLRSGLSEHDTVAELHGSRFDQWADSMVLETGGGRQGALYLLGCFMEMALIWAIFRCFDYRSNDAIRQKDLKGAAELADEEFNIREPTEGHHHPVLWSLTFIAAGESFGRPLPKRRIREQVLRTQKRRSNRPPLIRYASDGPESEDWLGMKRDAIEIRAVYHVRTVSAGGRRVRSSTMPYVQESRQETSRQTANSAPGRYRTS